MFLPSSSLTSFSRLAWCRRRAALQQFRAWRLAAAASTSSLAEPKSLVSYVEKLPPDSKEARRTLEAVEPAYTRLKEALQEAEELAAMAEGEEDRELGRVAEKELEAEVAPRIRRLAAEVAEALLPAEGASGYDEDDATLEVRAGAGGSEAAMFAQEVFELYCGYAGHLGFAVDVTLYDRLPGSSSKLTADTGVSQAAAVVTGRGVFRALKHECGVHRVQRVPVTGTKSDRLQTSTCSVAVVPRPSQNSSVPLRDLDLKFEYMRSQGAGGQSVNKTDSAVRVTHLPTGVVAFCEEERSQIRNKARAVEKLRAELYRRQFEEEAARISSSRRSQVGNMDRNEKIRTYNFSRNSIADHRVAGLTRQVPSLRTFFRGGGDGFAVLGELAEELADKARQERLEHLLKS